MKRNLVIITSFSFISAFLGLLGCENDRNSDVICKNNPEICADLHKDGWCLAEKTKLIQNRYELKDIENPTGKQLYLQLTYLEDTAAALNSPLACNISSTPIAPLIGPEPLD